MVIYVALVAILNLALGYALATFLAASKNQPAMAYGDADALDSADDFEDTDEWES